MLHQSYSFTVNPESNLKLWLAFISTLIWQLLIVLLVWAFHGQLANLFERLSKLRIHGLEAELQAPVASAEPIKPTGEAARVLELRDPSGFFTRDGVRQLISDSGLVVTGEEVHDPLLIFRTNAQHTWLVGTNRQMFCVLDDKGTRKSGRLIQWRLSLEGTQPVKARRYKRTVGLLDIGPRKEWLYSTALYPEPKDLETAVSGILSA